ncbi:hypothetical protein THII_2849 [Thioploca ingrica]|uniref:DUF2281 domain-containing protein n=1 Tax=Thioploca ingrica TaxID=40754 RepID=A0A090BVN1_9GAMM|nr:hypothetical protein THII_2849 [Thioploca ingrica]
MTNSEQHRLQQIFKQLPPEHQQTLLAFAEFLQNRVVSKPTPPLRPKYLPRPPEESVVAAIKRLSKSYPMLNKAKMLDETSSLMTEHILQGRDKVSVIDELEAIFEQRYEEFVREQTT